MNIKAAQSQRGIVHLGVIIGLLILVVGGVFVARNYTTILGRTQAASNLGSFSNLSAILSEDSAIFNFTYSGSSPNFKVDVSTSSNMKQNLYRNFGTAAYSPVIVSNPSLYSQYKCGNTLYWIIKATDQRSQKEIKSSVQTAKVTCSTGVGNTGPQSSPTLTPTPAGTPNPTPSASPVSSGTCTPQNKPAAVTLEGADGTWCFDSDKAQSGLDSAKSVGYCIDNCSYTNDYCESTTATGTVRDGYCTGTWNGTTLSNVHCDFGGYVCPSFGLTCSGGACI